MERLSVTQCRNLIGEVEAPIADEEVLRLRDMLYTVGAVITDMFVDLSNIDQTLLQPPNDLDDWLRDIGESQ